MKLNWADCFNGAITVCDRKGIIVYMNDASIRQFEKYGGEKLLGSSLIDCHPEPAKSKLTDMLALPVENIYTTEKNGIKKMVLQKPWMQNDEFKGIVEISFDVPNSTPHFIRK